MRRLWRYALVTIGLVSMGHLTGCDVTLGQSESSMSDSTQCMQSSDDDQSKEVNTMNIDLPSGWVIRETPDNPTVDYRIEASTDPASNATAEVVRYHIFDWGDIDTKEPRSDPMELIPDPADMREDRIKLAQENSRVSNTEALPDRSIDGCQATGLAFVADEDEGAVETMIVYVARPDGMWVMTLRSAPNEALPHELVAALDTVTWS
ncbi:MAG: hypothetical protein E6X12_07820 [Actinomyces sp.]|uniref:hypothetical protein n=1 Tax=Actinomyces ihuae TaxID=1673722 RepID=UPI00071D0C9A|nr:hypothetical protein [Actinomyces ihuae]MDU1521787.1 hypothetical protein [Actinomyces sp.]MDU2983128.1 hypothetical protein [Actinomyces sp.]MDU5006359.1 hypothetical protein [Actinomyces sp.]